MTFKQVLATLLALISIIPSAWSIYCFECDSSSNFTCTEFWDPTLPVTEQYVTDCSHVFEAKYCVKMTGAYDGKYGTKRFCSSKDWGDYCEYIKRPGDVQRYRSCVFSCTTNLCNGAQDQTQPLIFPLLMAIGSMLLTFYSKT